MGIADERIGNFCQSTKRLKTGDSKVITFRNLQAVH
jgi:hypothetical protein